MTTVLVTGASGFIAKHIVRQLLDDGYSVRASVRSDRARGEVEKLFPDASLEFVQLDLLSDDGWAEALEGVDALIHTASPFPAGDPDDPEELIRPAVDGTLRALRSAQAAGVTRVVLTSSCAAIYKDSTKPPKQPSTRANWTDPMGPNTTAYEASKTLAERAAWDFVAAHPEMRLTVINPGGVIGPPLDDHYGTSLSWVERLLAGTDKMYPRLDLPVVDVRDVARMHVRALSTDESIGQRFPAVAGSPTMAELASILDQAYPQRKISTREAPDWLVKLMSRFSPGVRVVISNLGRSLVVDGSDATRVFGFSFIPLKGTVLASAEYLVERGK